jgi:hypothetical protein
MAKPVAVIIIPSQWENASQLEESALALQAKVYFGRAEIVRVELDSSDKVAFAFRGRGGRFRFSDVDDLGTVMTLSHGGQRDGPVLFPGAAHHQPWSAATEDDSTSYGFTRDGLHFWTRVKMALAGGDPWRPASQPAKVILFGCLMGSPDYCDNYAQKVAWATGVPTWGATNLCAPANAKTVVDWVRRIENGVGKTLLPFFKEFSPSARCPA